MGRVYVSWTSDTYAHRDEVAEAVRTAGHEVVSLQTAVGVDEDAKAAFAFDVQVLPFERRQSAIESAHLFLAIVGFAADTSGGAESMVEREFRHAADRGGRCVALLATADPNTDSVGVFGALGLGLLAGALESFSALKRVRTQIEAEAGSLSFSYGDRDSLLQAVRMAVARMPTTDEAAGAVERVGARPGVVRVFYSYAHEDERFRKKLETHLRVLRRQGVISEWHDRELGAGTEWLQRIRAELDAAELILLLISPDFIASDFCWSEELARAMERHEQRDACVIPVILRPVLGWQDLPFAKLKAVPKDGRPVTRWSRSDDAYLSIAEGVRLAAVRLQAARV